MHPQSQPTIPAGLLAIDTSTEHAGIALSTSVSVQRHIWPAHREQTTTVLPEIDKMLKTCQMAPSDLTGLIVATGPGTFTGLRVGLALAKGMVAALSLPLVGIPTLDIVLAAHGESDLIAVLPAGRGRVVWQRRGDNPVNTTVPELLLALTNTPESLLVGEVPASFQEAVEDAHPNVLWEQRDPAVLLALGAARIADGDLDDPVQLEPTYLHGVTVNAPVIEDRL